MKKQLLFGTALFAAMSAFPQTGRIVVKSAAPLDIIKERRELLSQGMNETPSQMLGSGQIQPSNNIESARPAAATQISWKLLTGSSNTYGMLVSTTRPLQFHAGLNAVSFIHRKSDFYAETPALPSAAKTGVIVAEISSNRGLTFDSTCIWADATHWGRYPQGAIYNPTGNTSIANAYVVGCGPTVSGTSFTGDWYASKQLNSFNSTASTAPGAQQFLSFTLGTYPPTQPQHGWDRNGFAITDDGLAHTLSTIEDDLQALSTVRGWCVGTGSFSAGTFTWKFDTLSPTCYIDPSNNKYLSPDAQMAWNQAGTVGYVVGTGVLATTTLCNKSYQPIVYKCDRTVNPAATWTLMSGIDFNSAAMRPIVVSYPATRIGLAGMHLVPNPTTPANIDTVGVPFISEMDIAVDSHDKLHIGATFMSASTDAPDSLNFISQFTTSINPTEVYKWRHINGNRPYIYDFIGDGNTFTYKVVDSIATEGPSSGSGRPGYGENPWDPTGTGNAKITMEPRLEMGRTPDGKHIFFSWVESDTLFTNNAFKWNNLPDIKLRMMAVESGTNVNAYQMDLGPEQNMTSNDNNVKTRATLHYMAPTSSNATIIPSTSNAYTVDVFVPFTVTNSNPYSQLTNNATWFGYSSAPGSSAGNVTFRFPQTPTAPPTPTDVGVAENTNVLSTSYIYPNPAQGNAVIAMVLDNSTPVNVNVINAVGQTVKTIKVAGQAGENRMLLDLSGLSSGIYMVNIKAGDATTTKKLVIE